MTRTEAIIRRVIEIHGEAWPYVTVFAETCLEHGHVWVVIEGKIHSVSPESSVSEVMQWVTSLIAERRLKTSTHGL